MTVERDRLRELAYVGEHMHDDYSWKARHAELRAEAESLMKWKQTAEYWYGQYRLVKHGESPEQYPTEGKLDDWHNSYHNP